MVPYDIIFTKSFASSGVPDRQLHRRAQVLAFLSRKHTDSPAGNPLAPLPRGSGGILNREFVAVMSY
jgi:hypothetical protein